MIEAQTSWPSIARFKTCTKLIHYQTSLSLPSFLTAFVPVNLSTLTTQV